MPCLLAVQRLPLHNHRTAIEARLFHVIYKGKGNGKMLT